MRVTGIGVLGAALLALGAADASPKVVPSGEWGGRHLALKVSDSGATLEFDCAHAKIASALKLKDRRFEAEGTYTRERPGAVRMGDTEDVRKAIFRGTLEGDTLTLTITLKEDGSSLGTFTVARDKPARLFKCR